MLIIFESLYQKKNHIYVMSSHFFQVYFCIFQEYFKAFGVSFTHFLIGLFCVFYLCWYWEMESLLPLYLVTGCYLHMKN